MRSLTTLLFLLTLSFARAALAPQEVEAVRQSIRDRRLPEAEAAALKLTKAHSEDADAHVLLGQVYLRKEDADGAVKALEKAAALQPSRSEIQHALGNAYALAVQKAGFLAKVGWARKCVAAYERAVALDPRNVSARSSLMGFYRGAPGIAGGDPAKAQLQAAEISKLDPTRGHLAYGMLHTGNKKYDEALAEFELVLKSEPDNYVALYQIGRLAARSGGHTERGIDALRKALTLTPEEDSGGHDVAQWRLGTLLERQGDKAAAKAAYEASLRLNPELEEPREALKKLR